MTVVEAALAAADVGAVVEAVVDEVLVLELFAVEAVVDEVLVLELFDAVAVVVEVVGDIVTVVAEGVDAVAVVEVDEGGAAEVLVVVIVVAAAVFEIVTEILVLQNFVGPVPESVVVKDVEAVAVVVEVVAAEALELEIGVAVVAVVLEVVAAEVLELEFVDVAVEFALELFVVAIAVVAEFGLE